MSILINTERLNLKKIEKKDIKILVNHLNNWNVVQWLVNVPHPYTLNDAAKWLLIIGMLVGRLELMAVYILFTRKFWSN